MTCGFESHQRHQSLIFAIGGLDSPVLKDTGIAFIKLKSFPFLSPSFLVLLLCATRLPEAIDIGMEVRCGPGNLRIRSGCKVVNYYTV